MSGTFNFPTKGWLAIGLVMCVLAALAIFTRQFVAEITALSTAGIAAFDSTQVHLHRYMVRVRIARETTPMRHAFVQNPT